MPASDDFEQVGDVGLAIVIRIVMAEACLRVNTGDVLMVDDAITVDVSRNSTQTALGVNVVVSANGMNRTNDLSIFVITDSAVHDCEQFRTGPTTRCRIALKAMGMVRVELATNQHGMTAALRIDASTVVGSVIFIEDAVLDAGAAAILTEHATADVDAMRLANHQVRNHSIKVLVAVADDSVSIDDRPELRVDVLVVSINTFPDDPDVLAVRVDVDLVVDASVYEDSVAI